MAFIPIRTLADRLAGRSWSAGEPAPPHEVRWAVQAAAQRVPAATCLARSLACLALLRGSPQEVELKLGVHRRADSSIAAHAWVTCGGEPVLAEDPADTYTLLLTMRYPFRSSTEPG